MVLGRSVRKPAHREKDGFLLCLSLVVGFARATGAQEEPDFAAVAESMGTLGLTVTKAGEFAGALEQALASGRPAVIDVKTDIEGIAPRAWSPPAG